jgi:hypothetical protein
VRKTTRTVAVAGLVDETGLALARAYATPGVRLCLVGGADTLAVAAEDCRRRGARVDTLGTLDKDQPIDVLAVQAGSDFGRAMATIDPLIEPLRRRQQGAIVLIGARTEELLRYSNMVRQDLRPHGVMVMIASSGVLAGRLAARFHRPEIAAIGADKAARLICGGVSRRRKTVTLPGAGVALLRTLRLSPALLRNKLRERLAAPAEPIADPVAEEPLPEQAASGN